MCMLLHLYVSADKNCLDIFYIYATKMSRQNGMDMPDHVQCLIVKFGLWHIQYTVWRETLVTGKHIWQKTFLAVV